MYIGSQSHLDGDVDRREEIMYIPLSALDDMRSILLNPVIGWKFEYSVNPRIVRTVTNGSGTVTWSGGVGVASTTANQNSSAQILSARNFSGIPGLGVMVRFSAYFTTGVAGSTQLIGLGDDNNGFFFGYNGADWGVLWRQNGVDTWTIQGDWLGESPQFSSTIDPTLLNEYWITFPSGRTGLISFYIMDPVGGTPVLIHSIKDGNSQSSPALLHINLPLMAKVSNTSNNTNIQLGTTSAAAFTEGTKDDQLIQIKQHISTSKTGITTEAPIFTIHNKTTFASQTNGKTCIIEYLSIAVAGTAPTQVRFRKNATLTGASFSDINTTSSVVEYDTSATAFTGGTEIYTFMFASNDSNYLDLVQHQFYLNPNDYYTITATSSASTEVHVTLSWVEN